MSKEVRPASGAGRILPGLALASPAVLALGVVHPAAGLAVPALAVLAAAGSFRRKRWFCSRACPRGVLLARTLGRVSRRRPLPKALRSPGIRTVLCGFLLVCSVGQTVRLRAEPSALGGFFWIVCAATLALALVMGILWKPRAWCAVCPVGALQDNIYARTAGAVRSSEE